MKRLHALASIATLLVLVAGCGGEGGDSGGAEATGSVATDVPSIGETGTETKGCKGLQQPNLSIDTLLQKSDEYIDRNAQPFDPSLDMSRQREESRNALVDLEYLMQETPEGGQGTYMAESCELTLAAMKMDVSEIAGIEPVLLAGGYGMCRAIETGAESVITQNDNPLAQKMGVIPPARVHELLCPHLEFTAAAPAPSQANPWCGEVTFNGTTGTVRVTEGTYPCDMAEALIEESLAQITAAEQRSIRVNFDDKTWGCGSSGADEPYSCARNTGSIIIEWDAN